MNSDSAPELTSAMDAAIRILARRQHAQAELFQKLNRKGFDKKIIDAVLEECRARKYVDDAATVRFYLEELIRKNYGVHRVRQAMRNKGFDEGLIEEVAGEYAGSDEEMAAARKALMKKRPALDRETDSRKRREKAYRFLAGKGFSGEVVGEVMGAFV